MIYSLIRRLVILNGLLIAHSMRTRTALNTSSSIWFAWRSSLLTLLLSLRWDSLRYFIICVDYFCIAMAPIVDLLLHHAISTSHLLTTILAWWRGCLWSIFRVLIVVLCGSTCLRVWNITLAIIISSNGLTYVLLWGFSNLIQIG